MKIDVHNHGVPENAVELLNADPVYELQIRDGKWRGGRHVDHDFPPSFYTPEGKLEELERKGMDAVVVSVTPPLFYTDLDVEPVERLARAVNEGFAEWQREQPDRFRWMAHVPIAFPERAVAVLEDAAAAGAVGVEVTTRVRGRRLDEPEFEPFWDAAERLGLVVMPHPFDNEPHAGLSAWYLQNVIGNMLETTVTVERLICAGVLDRHPDLRLLLVHAGGYFPWQAGRLRHARTVRPELAEAPEDPWRYRGQIVVDTITHDREALAFLVQRMGADNVVLGTDLPYDMATPEPVRALQEAVDAETARRIAEENPATLFAWT